MKKINSIFLFSIFSFFSFTVLVNGQTQREKTKNFYVIASIGNNKELPKNSKLVVGNKIDLTSGSKVIQVEKYLAGIYDLNNFSFEFRGPGVFNLDSAIQNKKTTNGRDKLIAFVVSSVKGAAEGKNVKSASVEMSINSKVITFPNITKHEDSTFTFYWTVNNTFNKDTNTISTPSKKDIYLLTVTNSNSDTCFQKYVVGNRFTLNLYDITRDFRSKNNIYHWNVIAYTTDGNKFSSQENTFIFDNTKNNINSNLIREVNVDSLMEKLDYSIKNAYYSKCLNYARNLESLSPNTGKAAVQYSMINLLDYSPEETSYILPILFYNSER
jgi:hypothetical protein